MAQPFFKKICALMCASVMITPDYMDSLSKHIAPKGGEGGITRFTSRITTKPSNQVGRCEEVSLGSYGINKYHTDFDT